METYKVLIGKQEYEFAGIVETELLTTQIEDKKFVLGTKYELFTIYAPNQTPKLPNTLLDEKIKIFYKKQWHIAEWSFSENIFSQDINSSELSLHLRWEILNPTN